MSNESGNSSNIVRIVLYVLLAAAFVAAAVWALNNVGAAGGMGDGTH